MNFQFPKFVDRLELGLFEKINEFSSLIKENCSNFNEVFRIVPTQHSIWIETYELGSNYWNGKRTKIADRGVIFDLTVVYDKINQLIEYYLKVKSIQEIKNNQKLEIESVLKKVYKHNQFSINVETDSYKITLFWKKLFVITIVHIFGSDNITFQEIRFWDSFYIKSFNDLESKYHDVKLKIEELNNQIETDLIPHLPKF